MVNQFKKHKRLAAHIERMANTGTLGCQIEWDDFLHQLNSALERENNYGRNTGRRENKTNPERK